MIGYKYMKIEPNGHFLMEWDKYVNDKHEDIYLKGKIRLKHNKEQDDYTLSIKDTEGEFRDIKNMNNFWELYSLDTFLNEDINDDEYNLEYQKEFSLYIKDINTSYEYIVINKLNDNVYGVNGLLQSDEWSNETIKKMWEKDEVVILDISEEIEPQILTKHGWENIELNNISSDILKTREDNLEVVSSNI